ncbi:MAG: SIMPL domain-containing protein [Clostridiales bacterium]|uniref:SIMPL domain-containing protein n=1 Tax=Clostridium sp. N3C TaxID=1776758 RepID=UPI00092E1191|nr:SIMPL domain-containing protein [Clostridium sp. N3C]NLZ49740.1 SIMPL domain-containing protein [Clostridiales bacterium]SCN25270.1 26 kDa periplasmic immunogenic protein precursor [Clostridium sp. N3C]
MITYNYQNPFPLCNAQEGILKVTGIGSVSVNPTKANIRIGVITEDMSLEKAQAENTEKTKAVINSLYNMNISKQDIRTGSFDIQAQYDYIEGRQVFSGYRVSNILSVIIKDFSLIGEVIDTATSRGANRVEDINFSVEDPFTYYQEALDLAVKNASQKALQLSNSFRTQISPYPCRIIELTSSSPTERFSTLNQLATSATPILPGQTEIIAQIEAWFQYRGY